MKPSIVMRHQLPLMDTGFTSRLREIAVTSADGPVLWLPEMRKLAFTVSARSALGTLLSEKEVGEMYRDFLIMTNGSFAPVWATHPFLS
jgi:hypothetical protein